MVFCRSYKSSIEKYIEYPENNIRREQVEYTTLYNLLMNGKGIEK